MAHLRRIAQTKHIVWLVALVGALSLVASMALARSRPPAPRITSHPAALTKSTVSFGFTDAQRGAKFACKLDSSGYRTCSSPITYKGLSYKHHNFLVRALDKSGTASSSAQVGFTVHGAPPTVGLSFPSNAGVYNATSWNAGCPKAGICGSASDIAGVAKVQVSIKQASSGKYWNGSKFASSSENYLNATLSGTGTNVTWSYGFALPTDGGYTAHAVGIDKLNNKNATPVQAIFTIDTIAPAAPGITTKPAALSNSTSASFGFTDTESGVSSFRCKLDGNSFGPCANPTSYTSLAQGSHSFQVQALDSAGNASAASGYSWSVDSIAPVQPTIGTTHPANTTTLTGATFSFNDAETGVSFECQLDGGTWQTCASPKSYISLPGGKHVFQVRALDSAANASTPAAFNWTIGQSAPPAPTFTQTPASSAASTTAQFGFSDTQAGVSFECSIDNGTFAACTSPKTYNGLAQDSHTFQVRAVDTTNTVTGNTSTPASYTWVIDTVAPLAPTITASPTYPVANPIVPVKSTSATFAFADIETTAAFECSLDNLPFTACTSSKTYAGLSQGPHSFQVLALDALGNTSNATTYAWTVDTVAPVSPTITDSPTYPVQNPANPVASKSAAFAFADAETGVTFECSLDGGFVPCTSPASYATLADGPHTFQVQAIDTAGNVSAAASYTWAIDTTAPLRPSIDTMPPDPTASTSANFTFSDTEAGAAFECSIDSAAFAVCTSPGIYSGLNDGPHTFQVRALDALGNTSAPASYTWTINTNAPPVPVITANPTNLTLFTTAQFTFTESDPAAIPQCQLDQGPFVDCTSPVDYGSLSVANHTFAVRAVDALGNTSAAVPFTWTVEALVPFTISGNAPSALYPGAAAQPLDVTIANPNDFAITVTSIDASVTATGSAGCLPSWFATTSAVLPSGGIPIPAHGSGSVSSFQGASPPTLKLTETGTDQDACQGAQLTLSYTGSAQS